MKLFRTALISMLLVWPAVVMASPDGDRDVQQEQEILQDARLKALRTLFREQPGSQQRLESATGYAVFARVGLDLGLVSNRRLGGILRLNRSGRDTYYRVLSASGEEASAAEDFAAILVFQNDEAFRQFEVDGWVFSGQLESVMTEMPDTTIYLLGGTPASLQEKIMVEDPQLN
jgi:hypothetical protein